MIGTILVHLGHDIDCDARMRSAIACASRFHAHLAGVFPLIPVDMPAPVIGRAASAPYIAQASALAHERAEESKRVFTRACERDGLAFDWRSETGDPTEILSERLRYADVAMVSQTRPENLEEAMLSYPPDHLPLIGDGPVVILPHGRDALDFGRTILIGWKPSREAGRAVRGALPFLKRAAMTVIVTIGSDARVHESGKELATHLSRHGVRVETRPKDAGDGDAGTVLQTQAVEMEADLMVMGAYSRSRYREVIFGGATRQLLREMRIPILMAH